MNKHLPVLVSTIALIGTANLSALDVYDCVMGYLPDMNLWSCECSDEVSVLAQDIEEEAVVVEEEESIVAQEVEEEAQLTPQPLASPTHKSALEALANQLHNGPYVWKIQPKEHALRGIVNVVASIAMHSNSSQCNELYKQIMRQYQRTNRQNPGGVAEMANTLRSLASCSNIRVEYGCVQRMREVPSLNLNDDTLLGEVFAVHTLLTGMNSPKKVKSGQILSMVQRHESRRAIYTEMRNL